MSSVGMPVSSRKIARLGGDHRLLFAHGAHVDGLIRSRAGRENDAPRFDDGFEQSLAQRGEVDASGDRNHLQPDVGMNFPALQSLRQDADIAQPSSGASADFRQLDLDSCRLADRFDVSDCRRAGDLRLEHRQVHIDDLGILHVGIVLEQLEIFLA